MDYCECLTNSELGRNLANFLRRYTRQYCSGNECPLDGAPRGGDQAADASNHAMMGMILMVLLLSIFMSMRTSKQQRQRENDVHSDKVNVNSRNNRGPGGDGPPPAVN